jgi:hypothetical protein
MRDHKVWPPEDVPYSAGWVDMPGNHHMRRNLPELYQLCMHLPTHGDGFDVR